LDTRILVEALHIVYEVRVEAFRLILNYAFKTLFERLVRLICWFSYRGWFINMMPC